MFFSYGAKTNLSTKWLGGGCLEVSDFAVLKDAMR